MKQFFETLKAHIEQHTPNYGDGESVLTMLYECHNENNSYDNEQIKEDFDELYQQMNRSWIRSSTLSASCTGIMRRQALLRDLISALYLHKN